VFLKILADCGRRRQVSFFFSEMGCKDDVHNGFPSLFPLFFLVLEVSDLIGRVTGRLLTFPLSRFSFI